MKSSGNQKNRVLALCLLLVPAFALIGYFWPRNEPLSKGTAATQSRSATAPTAVVAMPTGDAPKQKAGGGYEAADPRWAEVRRLQKVDPAWQGRTPISFYGRAIDEVGQAVSGATVKFEWSDLSVRGASVRRTETDQHGLFALTGVRGKNLGVWVEKAGYYTSRAKNRFRYEYSGFWEKDFHEPEANNPVVFHLRKKGVEEPLIMREDTLGVAVGSKTALKLDEHTALSVQLLENGQMRDRKWSTRVAVSGGGLQITDEEFPFRAPSDGYQPEAILDRESAKPPTWGKLYYGGILYLKTPQGYGRVEIRMISGKSQMQVNSFLNPSGSPILEESGER